MSHNPVIKLKNFKVEIIISKTDGLILLSTQFLSLKNLLYWLISLLFNFE